MAYCILGAGIIGKLVYKYLTSKGIKVDCFIDDVKGGKGGTLFGRPIKSKRERVCGKLIAAIFSQVNYKIPGFIKDLHIDTSVYIGDLKEKHGPLITLYEFVKENRDFFEFVAKNHPAFWWRNGKLKLDKDDLHKIKAVEKAFMCDEDKKIFSHILRFMESFDVDYYPRLSGTPQYFPQIIESVLKQKNEIFFVDMGAYKGDTLSWLTYIFRDNPIKAVCIEPDPENFKELVMTSVRLSDLHPSLTIINIPIAAGENLTVSSLTSSGDSSRIDITGSVPVWEVPLDYIIASGEPTYIKMDVEGYEMNVLKGMKNIMYKFRPIIAVSLYHNPKDVINIPYFLTRHLKDYVFSIKVYRNFCLETVFYCIPKEECIL